MSSSLAHTMELNVDIKASANKFHDIFCNRPHHVKHTSAERVQGCELLKGDWGTNGSIIRWSYFHDGKARKAKQVVEGIDPVKNSFTLRVIEGDVLEEYKTFKVTISATPKSNSEGSIVHWYLEYEKKHEGIGHPETLVKFFNDLTKDMDAYLIKAE